MSERRPPPNEIRRDPWTPKRARGAESQDQPPAGDEPLWAPQLAADFEPSNVVETGDPRPGDDDTVTEEGSSETSFADAFWTMSAARDIRGAEQLREIAASALNSDNVWEAVAGGGTVVDDVRPGDLLVRSGPGGGIYHTAVVLSPLPEQAGDLAQRGIIAEPGAPGLFVEVAELPLGGGSLRIVGRRLSDPWARLSHGQTLLRTAPADVLPEVNGTLGALDEATRSGCIAPAGIPGIDSREAAVFGAVAEDIIYADFYRSNFAAAAPRYAVFRDDNNPAAYLNFLVFNNPSFTGERQRDYYMRLRGDRLVRIPDFVIHTAAERAFYEVKPGSRSGIRAGQEKVGTLQAVYQFYSLPYAGGTRFAPRDHRLAFLGSALRVRLRVRRIAPGLITYKICLESDAPLEVAPLVILLRYIVRQVNGQRGRGRFRPVDLQPVFQHRQLADLARMLGLTMATAATAAVARATWKHFWKAVVKRFAVRGAAAAFLSAADGPFPVGELLSVGLAIWTVVDIIRLSDELWREADVIARQEA